MDTRPIAIIVILAAVALTASGCTSFMSGGATPTPAVTKTTSPVTPGAATPTPAATPIPTPAASKAASPAATKAATPTPQATNSPTTVPASTPTMIPTSTPDVPRGLSLDFYHLSIMEYSYAITPLAGEEETTVKTVRWDYGASEVRVTSTSGGASSYTTAPIEDALNSDETGLLAEAGSAAFTTNVQATGSESIFVQKGVFYCKTYTIEIGDAVATYWIADYVPVPIKITLTEEGVDTVTMELADYQE